VENWNDERMDELSRRVDAGFKKTATKTELGATKEEMHRRFNGMDAQFGRINDRLDKLTFAILGILGTFAAATFATVLGSVVS